MEIIALNVKNAQKKQMSRSLRTLSPFMYATAY